MWNYIAQLARKHSRSKDNQWLKLREDGDRAVVAFLGTPHPREVCFQDGRYVPFTDELKTAGHNSSLRVALNVVEPETGELRVFEMSGMFYSSLFELLQKRPADKWVFEVQRHGAPRSPKTTYTVIPERELTDEERTSFSQLRLVDLAALYGDDQQGQRSLDSFDRKPTPISAQDAHDLGETLKALSPDVVHRFCLHFGVSRIKDLPADRVAEAFAFVRETPANPATDGDHQVDPFS
jgi:hypothetical protein